MSSRSGRTLLHTGSLLLLVVAGAVASEGADFHWGEPADVAVGEAYQGPWRMNDSDFRYVDDPAVAVNDAGTVAVVWADLAQKDILLQLFDSAGDPLLDAPANVSRSPDVFSWLPRVVLGEGTEPDAFLLWQEIIFQPGGSHGGEILFAHASGGEYRFGDPQNLSNTAAGAGKGRLHQGSWHNGSLDLARAPDGTLHAAWTEYEGPLHTARSTDGGASFTPPLRIAGDEGELPTRGPTLAVDSNGVVHLAWTVGEDPQANIRYTWSDDGGRSFADPRIAVEEEGHADAPAIATDDRGRVHLVYAVSPDARMENYRIRYARAEGVGRFSTPRPVAASDDSAQHFPRIAIDGRGRVYVNWEHLPDSHRRPSGLGFAWLPDGADDFVSPEVIPATDDPADGFNGGLQGLFMRNMAAGSDGEIVVASSRYRPGERSVIRLYRGWAE